MPDIKSGWYSRICGISAEAIKRGGICLSKAQCSSASFAVNECMLKNSPFFITYSIINAMLRECYRILVANGK